MKTRMLGARKHILGEMRVAEAVALIEGRCYYWILLIHSTAQQEQQRNGRRLSKETDRNCQNRYPA